MSDVPAGERERSLKSQILKIINTRNIGIYAFICDASGVHFGWKAINEYVF